MQRRTFLAVAAAGVPAPAQPAGRQFTKGICSIIFPDSMPFAEKFRRARDAGFAGIELRLGDEVAMDTPAAELERMAASARAAGIEIASLWVSGPLSPNPLNSPDADVRARGVEVLRHAVDIAARLGCGALLVVPGRLGSGAKFQVGYEDTWQRVTAELRKVLPYAGERRVILTPENVWNKFLVSPLEMRAFVDQFRSPWLQVHFDIGNVMQFGYPQDWILTLGARIRRVHAKDYKLSARAEEGRFVDLFEGDVDWKEVMSALVKVGYRGFISPEIGGEPKDPEKIVKVSRALDRILAMA
jgi:hexulose-6-phosphate isomerase